MHFSRISGSLLVSIVLIIFLNPRKTWASTISLPATSKDSQLHVSFDLLRNDHHNAGSEIIHRTSRAGRRGSGSKRPRPSSQRIISEPIRRQEMEKSGPGLNITSVSPIELSLGGLTGLQGLPPLSLIQFVKLLVAVTPFVIPLIFVPLLIFTVGMFMIPVQKPSFFVGDGPVRRSSSSSVIYEALKNAVRNFMRQEDCFERVVCEISDRCFETRSGNADNYRSIIGRVANHINHPVMKRLSTGLRLPKDLCKERQCGLISFFEKSFKNVN